VETIREFAAEQLSADSDFVLIAGRHAHWCLHQVIRIRWLLVGSAEADGVARLAELWPNLRAAFDWACATGDCELADALVRPVAGEVNLRKQTEIGDWAERILALTASADEEQVVFWLVCVTYRFKQSGDRDEYERLVDRYGDPDHPWSATPARISTMTAKGCGSVPPSLWPGFAGTARITRPSWRRPAAWHRV
jgi:hypothetical protein